MSFPTLPSLGWRRPAQVTDAPVAEKLLSTLHGADREVFADVLRPQLAVLKRTTNARQVGAIDRLIAAVSFPTPPQSDGGKQASTPPVLQVDLSAASAVAPTAGSQGSAPSPPLRVDVSSAAPTPVLTMEPNTPQSSGPPSTHASALGEPADDGSSKSALDSDTMASCPEVRVDEA